MSCPRVYSLTFRRPGMLEPVELLQSFVKRHTAPILRLQFLIPAPAQQAEARGYTNTNSSGNVGQAAKAFVHVYRVYLRRHRLLHFAERHLLI